MTKTLREQLDSRRVRYRMENVFVQTIEGPNTSTVLRGDNTFGEVKKPGVYLQRIGDGSTKLSDGLDPLNEDHKVLIDKYDEWIAKNPFIARRNGIEKIGVKRPAARIPRWDHMDVGQIEAVLEATQPDLLWAMEYELYRDDELGGPRQDVIDLLEDINVNGYMSSVEESDVVPAI